MPAGIPAQFSPDDTGEIRRIRDAVHALDEQQADPRRVWWVAIGVTACLTALFAMASFGQAVWAGDDLGNSATATNLRIGWAIGVIVLCQLVLAYSRQVAMSCDHHEQTEDLREQAELLRAVLEAQTRHEEHHTAARERLQIIGGHAAGRTMLVAGSLDAFTVVLDRLVDRVERLEQSSQPDRQRPATSRGNGRRRTPRRTNGHKRDGVNGVKTYNAGYAEGYVDGVDARLDPPDDPEQSR